jgi:hypothetical protein
MGVAMDEGIKNWAARRESALVLWLIQERPCVRGRCRSTQTYRWA